jgi:hypothetical protein
MKTSAVPEWIKMLWVVALRVLCFYTLFLFTVLEIRPDRAWLVVAVYWAILSIGAIRLVAQASYTRTS